MARRRPGRRNPWARADRFTREAKKRGYAARSVFKLAEIQRRFRVLRPGDRVVDLGCAPGSWSRFALEQVGSRGVVVGVDVVEPEFAGGVVVLRSVHEVEPSELRDALGGGADAVLSDMAPRTTGNPLGDHVAQVELASRARDLALALLAPGGRLVVKVFDGEDAHAFVQSVRPHFERVRRTRPDAVRRESREFFLVCQGFHGRPVGGDG